MSVRLIDFNRLAVYEAGALLVTLLAFPDASDETQGNVQASLCNYALKVRSAIEHDWTILPQPIKPFYAFRSERDCNRDLRTLVRRWRDRMVAGRHGDRLSERSAARPGTGAPCDGEAALDKSIGRAGSRRYPVHRPSQRRNPHLAAEPASRPSGVRHSSLFDTKRGRHPADRPRDASP